MAHQLKDSIFKIIVGKASDFLRIGMGASDNVNFDEIQDDILGKVHQVTIEGGGFIICDNCNGFVTNDETCYYIPVLNRVFCEECFTEWHKSATYYADDAEYEERYFENVRTELIKEGVWNENEND